MLPCDLARRGGPSSEFHTQLDTIPLSHADIYKTWVAQAEKDASAARVLSLIERHPEEELYDTVADPHELHNLASQSRHRKVKLRLKAELKSWMETQQDPLLKNLN